MLLPSEYQEVEYIQSSGDGTNSGQYIDIGYSFQNNKGRISMKYSPVNFGSSFSGKRATGSYNSTRSIYVYGNYSSFYIGMGSNDINTGYTMTTGTDYEVDIAADNGNYTLSYNGNTSSGTYSSTIVNNRTLSIFSAHVSDSGANEYNYRSSMKLYYYKLWDNGVLQRDLVPCYRKQDSVIGLYDLVNNQFYTNSGTGTFTKGADVNGYKIKRVLIWVNNEEKQIYPAIPEWNGDISKATTYTRLTTSTSSEQMEFGIQFNPDGTKWYSVCYNAANVPVIKQWTLSTPRDITTSTLQWSSQKGTSSSWGNYPSIYICNNGNYVYFCDNPHPYTGNGLIYLYSLSTPRDLSSTWTQINTFSKQVIQKIIWVSDDGKAFITGFDNATNTRYMFYSTSSTAWNWNSSGTTIRNFLGFSAFSNDGTKIYYTQDNSKVVDEYSLSTPYNPTTQTLVQSKTLDTVSNLQGITFDTGGDNMYVCANSRPSANYVYQYSLK